MMPGEFGRFRFGVGQPRSAARKALQKLSLLAVVAGATALSCSAGDVTQTSHPQGADGRTGSVGLSLVPVSGVTLSSIHYVVTSSATPPATVAEGDLPSAGSAKDLSFGLSLPVGTGYKISFSAASAEAANITCSGALGPFNVTPNASSNVSVTLTCIDATSGELAGGGGVVTDACPRLVVDYTVASPAAQFPGLKIAVAAHAHDLDGKPVSYAWSYSAPFAGTFSAPTAATTDLLCTGPHSLGAIVTMTASNGECTKSLTTIASCRDLTCGNGVIDPGETCDTATVCAPGSLNCIPGNKCPSDCTFVCGDGVAEPPAEDCDPPNTLFCDPNCHIRIDGGGCGDGFLEANEPCDGNLLPPGTPACTVCAPDCSHLTAPVCGDGTVAAGCEQCDDHGPSPLCSNTCFNVSTPACLACEQAGDCSASADNCLGGGAFTGVQQTQCYSVMTCIEKNNCLDGTGSLGRCYCGTLSTSACGAAPFDLTKPGAPNGVCAQVIQAGMSGLTSNSAVLGALTASARPAGAAMQRLNCQKIANNSACLDACGFTVGGPAFP